MSRIICSLFIAMFSLILLFFALMMCYSFFVDLCSRIPDGWEHAKIQIWQGFNLILITVVILAILVIVFSFLGELIWLRKSLL